MSRLRKWIILRLVSIVDSLHMEKEEALIEEVARCETRSNPSSSGGGEGGVPRSGVTWLRPHSLASVLVPREGCWIQS